VAYHEIENLKSRLCGGEKEIPKSRLCSDLKHLFSDFLLFFFPKKKWCVKRQRSSKVGSAVGKRRARIQLRAKEIRTGRLTHKCTVLTGRCADFEFFF